MELVPLLVLLVRYALLVLPALLLYQWHRKRAPYVAKVDKIPGPKSLPILGNALDMLKSPIEIFNNFGFDLETYGPTFRFWILSQPQVVIQRARDAEVILQGMTHHNKSENYKFLHPWMGQGLLTSSGEMWRVHRKVLTPAFHFNILHEFLPVFNKHALKLTRCLAPHATADRAEHGFNIFKYSSLCSLDIICESSMGTKIDAQDDENSPYVHAVNRMNDLLIQRYFSAFLRFDWSFNLSALKKEWDQHLTLLNNFTDKVIAERRKYLKSLKLTNTNKKDDDVGQRRSLAFLDLLLAAEEEGSEHMTHKEIRDQVSTFMFEGHDTVSTAMSWVLFMIGTYPEVQARVVEELNKVFGESGRAPEMSDLANLKYLERCIKETLRLYPSVAFYERSLKEDAQLEHHLVPAGCTVSLNVYMLHRDPEFWPEPEKFNPDRFLPENVKGRHPYAYIPFSAGPRNCIGQKYAIMEEKVVVSTVLRRFKVEAAHPREDAQLQVGMVLRPQNGLQIRLYDRESHPKLRVSS